MEELEWKYEYQPMQTEVYVEVDSDWAQCPRTRRSTGGGVVMLCKHMLDSYCAQQHSVALSSAEAELHEIVQGAARGLFVRHVIETLVEHPPAVIIATDSSAAQGITSRLGAGRVRHLEAKELWIQEKARSNEILVKKIGTDGNRADLMTKFLDGERHHTLLGALPLVPGTRRTTEHLAVGALLLAARV